ncbi:MAG: hypothetical protein IJ128_08510 [Firmicutes bacterium]|nr:hypothetical protein [Bacillota bacterium]
MSEIRESIEYFLMLYDEVMEEIRDKRPNVVRISPDDVRICAKRLQAEERNRDRSRDRGSNEGGGPDGGGESGGNKSKGLIRGRLSKKTEKS